MTANTSLSGIQLSAPASQSFATVLPKPKPSSVTTSAAVSGDPFAPTTSGKVISQQPRRSVSSGFPEVSFPPPTSKIHQKSANLQQQETAKPVFTAAAVPNTSESNFANFEVANFRAPSEDQKGECTKIL